MDKSSTKSENNKNAETVLEWKYLAEGPLRIPSGYEIVYARGERPHIKGHSAVDIIKMLESKAMELMKKGEKVHLISRTHKRSIVYVSTIYFVDEERGKPIHRRRWERKPGGVEMVYYLVREEKTPCSVFKPTKIYYLTWRKEKTYLLTWKKNE